MSIGELRVGLRHIDADCSVDVLRRSEMIEALESDVDVLGSSDLIERAHSDRSKCFNAVSDAVHRYTNTTHC